MSAHDENAYDALTEEHGGGGSWAFGTGIEDVQTEITSPVPDGVDPADLAQYCLMLGDDALVCGHRISEWVSNAPELEEEMALANTALDLIGQARVLLARAAHLGAGAVPMSGSAAASVSGSAAVPVSGSAAVPMSGSAADEDELAYLRLEPDYRNVALAELGDELDFARAIARLLIFSTWRLALMSRLVDSRDPVIAAVAGKGVKELAYHRDHAVRWTLRLGDGTPESHTKMQAAFTAVWPYVEELFRTSDVEQRLVAAGVAVDPAQVRGEVDGVLDQVLAEATLDRPHVPGIAGLGGRQGRHTEMLGHVLAEMQSLARQHPGASW